VAGSGWGRTSALRWEGSVTHNQSDNAIAGGQQQATSLGTSPREIYQSGFKIRALLRRVSGREKLLWYGDHF